MTQVQFGFDLFKEFKKLFPNDVLELTEVDCAEDNFMPHQQIIFNGERLKRVRWPVMTTEEWFSRYCGLSLSFELVNIVYHEIMMSLGKWRYLTAEETEEKFRNESAWNRPMFAPVDVTTGEVPDVPDMAFLDTYIAQSEYEYAKENPRHRR